MASGITTPPPAGFTCTPPAARPANIEGSVVLAEAGNLTQGGMMLSNGSATAYVILDNLEIKNWFNHGIGTPGGMNSDIYHHLTVRNLTIKDVNGAGVNLSSWLERPSDGRKGLRGGYHLVFTNNLIDGANSFGITGYFAEFDLRRQHHPRISPWSRTWASRGWAAG